jgi:hypothetical protein
MWLGLAAALLVFTGVWHLFEWAVHGVNADTVRLVPFGIIYTLFGALLAAGVAEAPVGVLALLVTAAGMTAAYLTRMQLQIGAGVLWGFILIDVVIVLSLLGWFVGA